MNDKLRGKRTVPYPALLDGFGIQLKKIVEELNKDSMKPAIMADVRNTVNLMCNFQQLMVHMYNLNVANYEAQMVKITDLETRLAGYSERLNQTEARISKLEKGGKE